jgi:cytoskeletal protein RodZ
MKKDKLHTKEEVERLLQKFMDGTTTLEEEALLGDFFRTHEVTGEWATYKKMFAMFDTGKVVVEAPRRKPLWWRWAGIAAAIILLIALGIVLRHQMSEKPNLIAKTDTTQTAPQPISQPSEKIEEQPDTTNRVKETATVPTDSIIFSAPAYRIAAIEPEEASEPDIKEIDPAYEEMKRAIRSRGEEMISQVELAINIDLDDY